MGTMVNWAATARRVAIRVGGGALAVELRLRAWAVGTGPPLRRLGRWTRDHHVAGRLLAGAGLVLVALVGMSVGLLLGGRVHQDVGPFAAQFTMRPSLSGGTSVQIPPLGSLDVHTHDGPAHVEVTVDSVDPARAAALVNSPHGVRALSQSP